MKDAIRVLHVDDDESFLDLVAGRLADVGDDISVVGVASGRAALDVVDDPDRRVDCVVADYRLPDVDGLDLLDAVRERRPGLPYLLFTGKGSEAVASEAISAGVTDYVRKDFQTDQWTLLATRIRNAVEQHRTQVALDDHVQAIEAAPDGIGILDSEGRLSYVNDALAECYGTDPERLQGDHWSTLYPEDERGRLADVFESSDESEWRGTATGRRADGSTYPQDLSLTRTGDHRVCVLRDVTDRRREHELQESRRRFRTLLGNLPGMAYRARNEPDWPFEFASDGCRELTGYDPDQLTGGDVTWSDVIHPDDRGDLWDPVQEAIDRGESFQIEYRILTADDECKWVWEQGTAVDDADEDVEALEGFITDVTDRKRKTERLETFASVVSHDLRTPLSVASAELQFVAEDVDRPEVANALAALDRMDDIIGEVLQVARGPDDPDPRELSVIDVARTAWEHVDTAAGDLVLEASDDAAADPTAVADRDALLRVFENFFRNAVDHAGDDVDVRVGPLPTGCYVADDGPGIPDEDHDSVFDPGYTTRDGGTGYGLTSVEQVARVHGWEVTVTESEAGGARFEIRGLS